MVEIEPFRGFRYNKEQVGDFSLVITPPYDVINEEQKNEFKKGSSYNMVNLILGNDPLKVAETFKEWQETGILVRDEKESLYVYGQEFSYNKDRVRRIGFVSLVKVEELGKGILPHEKTLEKPFKERLALINATRANFGSVFLLYDDREKIIDGMMMDAINGVKPDLDFRDKEGIHHTMWRVSDEGFIQKIQKEMGQYQCIIADGHHRYRSALKFREEHPEIKGSGYTMCCFVNSFNEGLFILPIDRFIFGIENLDFEGVLERLKEEFEVEEIANKTELIRELDNTDVLVDKSTNLKNHVFGLYSYSSKKSYLLKLINNSILEEYYPDDTDIYKKLDINILHKIIFEKILNISEEDQLKGTYIEYTKGPKRALEKLENGEYQIAFFVNAPLMREIFLTARAGETMPQKSTYFYPKIYSGIVINKIE
jgi:uncharacterized protein (DUF1015 family)